MKKCIQVGYAGVVQEKLEQWPKIVWDQGNFSIKRGIGVKLCMQLIPHKRMLINVSYSYLFYSYWTFKELSRLTKYTRLGRLPEGKSQVKRFGVSIHHAYTAI